MYSVYDFVNTDIDPKHMKFGWKAEVETGNINNGYLILRYRMLNFDESSLQYIGNDLWNMFLSSKSYEGWKNKMGKALRKHKRLYFIAKSITDMKSLIEKEGMKIDVSKLVETLIRRKSETVKTKLHMLNKRQG